MILSQWALKLVCPYRKTGKDSWGSGTSVTAVLAYKSRIQPMPKPYKTAKMTGFNVVPKGKSTTMLGFNCQIGR